MVGVSRTRRKDLYLCFACTVLVRASLSALVWVVELNEGIIRSEPLSATCDASCAGTLTSDSSGGYVGRCVVKNIQIDQSLDKQVRISLMASHVRSKTRNNCYVELFIIIICLWLIPRCFQMVNYKLSIYGLENLLANRTLLL